MSFHLLENRELQQISEKFRRSPTQINQFLESDAELLRLPDGSVLAATTDCIAEEIATGLYHDPAHIGWMTVVVNLSDLAAVGAKPLGLLLSESLPADFPNEKLQAVQSGIAEACAATGTFVLGGDTNQSETWQMGGTALGLIPAAGPIISRKGAQVGDVLYCSGSMGLGSAYAFEMLLAAQGQTTISYRPMPRLVEGNLVRQFGSSCIDSSDGFLHALCNLLEVNEIGFKIEIPLTQMAHPEVMKLHKAKQLPAWIFLAGPHGEFELVFTIPQKNEQNFLAEAQKMHWSPLRIGICSEEKDCSIRLSDGTYQPFYPCQIANAYAESNGDPKLFLTQLLKLETQWQIQKMNC